jgi:hypothetical protein
VKQLLHAFLNHPWVDFKEAADGADRGAADPIPFHRRLATRVPIKFLIPAVRRMVVASRIRLHGGMRTVLPHAPVLFQASAREARANGRRTRQVQ